MRTETTEKTIAHVIPKVNKKENFKHADIRDRMQQLLAQIGSGLYEREQILAISLLGTVCGQNTFLFGPPGTAKSLISRRLACAFRNPKYFEYLMNRFSTPEEVFGPVSIKELKEDKYVRKVEGYLPTADFAFLDEIWKSSPAILNTLLTLINEHVFKNGNDVVKAPLKSLVAASNEVPTENQGLDALYDRFILRLLVPPIVEEVHFNKLLDSKPSSSNPIVNQDLTIDYQELSIWQQQLHKVTLSDDVLLVVKKIRTVLSERFDDLKVYVSDRRWQRSAMVLKASAFCNGREETNLSDAILLKHCLWTSMENRQEVYSIVMQAIENCGFTSGFSFSGMDKEKESLENEINKELFYKEDVYKTVSLKDGEMYFKVEANFKRSSGYDSEQTIHQFYIPYSKFKEEGEFKPVDAQGNEVNEITCKFDKQGSCVISLKERYYRCEDITFTPQIQFHKGDKKDEVNERLVESLASSVGKLRTEFKKALHSTEEKLMVYIENLDSLFTTEQETDVAVKGIHEQIEQLKLRIKDCERLESLCK